MYMRYAWLGSHARENLSLPTGGMFKSNDDFVVLLPYDHVEGTFSGPCFGYASPLVV